MTKFIDIKRKSLSLLQSGCIQLQLVVSSITSWKHTVQAVPSKKKKKEKLQEEKRKGREKERKEVEKKIRRKRDGKSLCGRKEKRGE